MTDQLVVTESPIRGLYVVDLVLHGDDRGWFKENYQKQKLEALGRAFFTRWLRLQQIRPAYPWNTECLLSRNPD